MEVDSAAELEEVLAWSEDETVDVGEEEEVAGLPFDAGEGEDSDDEPSPAGGAGLWDPSPGEIATLEEEIEKLDFPNLEDGTGNFGEKTMDNAVAMLMAKTGRGLSLKRENKTKLFTKKQEKTSCMRNRWSSVWIKCCQGGKPRACQRVADPSARRNTTSQKVCLPEVRTDVELPMLSSRHRCISAPLFSASGDESSDRSREESQWKWTWG
ncbi:unnamed protein product, partial [Ectocarpus sp. 12 AP-2014]